MNEMKVIDVRASREYQVIIGQGLIEDAGERIAGVSRGSKAVVISDTNVAKLYADDVRRSLERAGFETSLFTFPAGEENKNANTLMDMLAQDRKSVV